MAAGASAGPVTRTNCAPTYSVISVPTVHRLPGALPRYTTGRVGMIGDTAHGTLPTMGAGAATALEDALCVSLLIGAPLAAGGRLTPALRGFGAARRPRCRALAVRDRVRLRRLPSGGRLAADPPQQPLMRRTPTGAILRGSHVATGWTAPQPAAPVH